MIECLMETSLMDISKVSNFSIRTPSATAVSDVLTAS